MYRHLFLALSLFCSNALAVDLPKEKLDEIELKVANLHGTELEKKQLRIAETRAAKLELRELKTEAIDARKLAVRELNQKTLGLRKEEVQAAKISLNKGYHPRNCKEKIHNHSPKLNVVIDGYHCDIHGPEGRHLVCNDMRKKCAIDDYSCGFWSFVGKPIADSPHRYYWISKKDSAFCMHNPESKRCGGDRWMSVERAIPQDSPCKALEKFDGKAPSKMSVNELNELKRISNECVGNLGG